MIGLLLVGAGVLGIMRPESSAVRGRRRPTTVRHLDGCPGDRTDRRRRAPAAGCGLRPRPARWSAARSTAPPAAGPPANGPRLRARALRPPAPVEQRPVRGPSRAGLATRSSRPRGRHQWRTRRGPQLPGGGSPGPSPAGPQPQLPAGTRRSNGVRAPQRASRAGDSSRRPGEVRVRCRSVRRSMRPAARAPPAGSGGRSSRRGVRNRATASTAGRSRHAGTSR